MTTKVLLLKLTDLFLFSLVAKSKAGIPLLEQEDRAFVTFPHSYFWIFFLNRKLNKTIPGDLQNSLIRSVYWIWQIVFTIKRYYKEKESRFRRISIKNILYYKVKWFRTVQEENDIPKTEIMDLYSYYKNFVSEINKSPLSPREKNQIINLSLKTYKYAYINLSRFMKVDFDKLNLKDILFWYKITYQMFSEFVTSTYLIYAGIKPKDPNWQECIKLIKDISIIGAAHDDMSDIIVDINENGCLREPNLFAVFLTKEEKKAIGKKYKGVFFHLTYNDLKKEFPQAFKQFNIFIDQSIENIKIIPMFNLQEIIRFFVENCPEYFIRHIPTDAEEKKLSVFSTLEKLAFEKRSLEILEKFRSLLNSGISKDKKQLLKKYKDLVSLLYVYELSNSGLPLKVISETVNRPRTTVLRWQQGLRLPIGIRSLLADVDQSKTTGAEFYYLLGVFICRGHTGKNYLQISHPDINFLLELEKAYGKTSQRSVKNCNLRFYNSSLARQIASAKKNLSLFLNKADSIERRMFIQGVLSAVNKQGKTDFNFYLKKGTARIINTALNTYLEEKRLTSVKKISKNHIRIFINAKSLKKDDKILNETHTLEKYLPFAKSVILKYFGLQKPEFWDEFPGLLYICLDRTDRKIKKEYIPESKYGIILKFQILEYFKKYFSDLSKTRQSTIPTDINEIETVTERIEDKNNYIDKNRLQKALSVLARKDKEKYFILSLRFGLIDGKEYLSPNELSKRLFEMGVKGNNNTPLTKSQIYGLLTSSLSAIRSLVS